MQTAREVCLVAAFIVALLLSTSFGGLAYVRDSFDSTDSRLGLYKNICQLLDDYVTIDCSNKGFSSIPTDLKFSCREGRCITLDLSDNKIQVIDDYAFRSLPTIVKLILSGNKITTISSNAFIGLRDLEVLMLTANELHYNELKSVTFEQLPSLNSLFLEKQAPLNTQVAYPSQILSSLKNFNNLSIDFVYNGSVQVNGVEYDKVKKFDEGFENMTSLQRLVLFPSMSSNRYVFVPEGTFQHVSNIIALSMRSCRIGAVEEAALSYFTRLRSIDLGLNDRLGLESAINLLRRLHSPLTHLDLEHVSYYLHPVKLTKNMTQAFAHLPIENISLVNDHIVSIEGEAVTNTSRHLREIYIGQNYFAYSFDVTNLLTLALNMMAMKNLSLVDISYYSNEFVSPVALYNSPPNSIPPKIAKHMNKADYAEEPLAGAIVKFPRKRTPIYVGNHFKIILPKNLKTVIAKGAFHPGDYVNNIDCELNNVTYIDVSHSNFKYWPIHGSAHLCFNALLTADLGYNDFTVIKADSYLPCPNLRKLILAGNRLYVMLRDKGTKHFANLPNLEYLDLANNNLVTELYPEMFSELPAIQTIVLRGNRLFAVANFKQARLQFLDLSGNNLDDTFMDISDMPSLKKIIFARNRIQFVSEGALQLWHGKKVKLDLSQNPFNCSSCQSLSFLRWFKNVSSNPRTVTFLSPHGYLCRDKFHQKLSEYVGEVDLKRLEDECRKLDWIVISITVSTGVALLITLIGMIYRHRWTIKFWIVFAARRGPINSLDRQRRFHYDAFLIYSSEDRHWVHDVLREKLEEDNEFGLCIHYRNFLPGQPIEENIMYAIENSRHSILVLSRNFLKSEWCIFEMHMARNIFRQQRRDILILILLEDIPVQDSPLTLINMLRTRTYLKWPADDDVGQEAFWEMLKQTLKKEPGVTD